MKVRRFLLFGVDNYYPAGGWDDFIESFDSEEEAKTHAINIERKHDYYQVVDLENIGEEVRIIDT